MPPVRIRERGRAKKGTMKRLLKQLFKLYPGKLVLVLICLLFTSSGVNPDLLFSDKPPICIVFITDKPLNRHVQIVFLTQFFNRIR